MFATPAILPVLSKGANFSFPILRDEDKRRVDSGEGLTKGKEGSKMVDMNTVKAIAMVRDLPSC